MKNNLKAIRKASGMSQNDLARETGMTQVNISKYENGAYDLNNAKASTVLDIAHALDCTVEDLLGRSGIETIARKLVGSTDEEMESMIADSILKRSALWLHDIDSFFNDAINAADDPDVEEEIMEIESDVLLLLSNDKRICCCESGTYVIGGEYKTFEEPAYIDDKFESLESALKAAEMS